MYVNDFTGPLEAYLRLTGQEQVTKEHVLACVAPALVSSITECADNGCISGGSRGHLPTE